MNRRVLLVGLDGATFDVMEPLIEDGWMPNLKRIIENGTSGPLQSTIPPVTGPAWLTLATGMRPEKTGIFDFFYLQGENYKLRGFNSALYKDRSIWDYLSQASKHVVILNYPLLKPPYEINGLMTSGIGTSPNDKFVLNKDMEHELNKIAGGRQEFYIPYHSPRYDNPDLFMKDLERVLDKQVRVAEFLLKEKKWDFFCVILSETDWLQHLMWRHIDDKHPLHEASRSKKYEISFKGFWTKIDSSIGRFHKLAGEETNIVILSDHGFGPNDQTFKINAWLEREGYLIRKRGFRQVFNKSKGSARSSFKAITKILKIFNVVPGLYEWGRKATGKMRPGVLDQISLEESIAFDPGHTIPFGGIYLNARHCDTPQKKKKLASEITEKLMRWGQQNNAEVDIWPLSGVVGPDLLIAINDWRCVMLKNQFDGDLFEQRPYSPRHTGSHRLNGSFIAMGPDVLKSKLDQANICDIAPTLLYLFDQSIPRDMDGRILSEIIDPKYFKSHPPKFNGRIRTKKGAGSEKTDSGMTESEEEALRNQLRGLGYM